MEKKFSILKVDRIIECNLAVSSLNGAFIANQLGISRMQLHRELIKKAGVNTRDYIRIRRIEKAKKLLMESNLPIRQISYQIGFSSLAYFSRVFKNVEGIPPSNFTKRRMQ